MGWPARDRKVMEAAVRQEKSNIEATMTENGMSAPGEEAHHGGCILVVTGHDHPSQPVMTHAINVADRLGAKLIMVKITSSALVKERSRSLLTVFPRGGDHQKTDVFRMQAAERGVTFEKIHESGNICKVIKRLCHVVKRVEFAVIDQDLAIEEVAAASPVPVFSVVSSRGETRDSKSGHHPYTPFQGDIPMKAATRKTYLAKTLVFGGLTAGLYAAVFAYADEIMHYWTKGGIYCLLPVATVFVFSYAHGSFTGNFWSALGIEGSKASTTQKKAETTVSKGDAKRPDTRPRVQVNA